VTKTISDNLAAFLDMIAWSEGTSQIPDSDDGYKVIVTSTVREPKLISDYKDHPRKVQRLTGSLFSSAAGRYQILQRYWDHYRNLLHLFDFSPGNQDLVAIQQIKEMRALGDIEAGRFNEAVRKVRNIWASLPGSGYGQPQRTLEACREKYVEAGGEIV